MGLFSQCCIGDRQFVRVLGVTSTRAIPGVQWHAGGRRAWSFAMPTVHDVLASKGNTRLLTISPAASVLDAVE